MWEEEAVESYFWKIFHITLLIDSFFNCSLKEERDEMMAYA